MEAKTKKRVIIFSAAAVIVGIGAYLWWKHKKKQAETPPVLTPETKSTDNITQSATTKTGTKSPISTSKPAGIATGTKLLNAAPILSKNPAAVRGMQSYAVYDGSTIFSNTTPMKAIGKTKKGEYLGVAMDAKRAADGTYFVNITDTHGKQFIVIASGVNFLM